MQTATHPTAPHRRPHKPIQYGRVTAGSAPATPARLHLTLNLADVGALPEAPDAGEQDDAAFYLVQAPYLIAQIKCLRAVLSAVHRAGDGGHVADHLQATIEQIKETAEGAIDAFDYTDEPKAQAMRASLAEALEPRPAANPLPASFPFIPVLLADVHKSIYNLWVRVCDQAPNSCFKTLVVQRRALLDWGYLT